MGDDFRLVSVFCVALGVRQLIHAVRQSTRLSGRISHFSRGFLMLLPYSALSLVRQWIHVYVSL